MTNEISGKIAVVTGANRGIGLTIVHALLANGASKVYAAVRNPDSLKELQEANAGRLIPVQADLTDSDSINALAQIADDAQIVINNAGILIPATPLSSDATDKLSQEMDVNVYGLLRMAQAFTPVLEKNSNGVFVQLNSVASIKNFLDFSTYSASKAAAFSITQGLRDQLAEKGIDVISVHPGPIVTDMAKQAGMEEMGEPPEVVADAIIDAITSGKYLVFPDSMAKDFENAYAGYASAFIEV